MKKIGTLVLVLLGLAFLGGGAYSITRGLQARDQVRTELLEQKIVAPADSAIPGAKVDDARTAKAMGDIIDVHSRKITGGRTYAELGRYVATDGNPAGTSVEAQAVLGPNGRPVANPLRVVAFEGSALRTSLYTSVMAFNVADLVIGLGFMMLALGAVLGGAGICLGRRAVVRAHQPRVDLVSATPLGRNLDAADQVATVGR